MNTSDLKVEDLSNTLNLTRGEKSLVVVFGILGDFDSIEYAQHLVKLIPSLNNAFINLHVFGIGDQQSKIKFCNYTGLPEKNIIVNSKNHIHDLLDLSRGLQLTPSPLFNLLLMCIGIQSPGTLKEVFRGYIGDHNAPNIFKEYETIDFKFLPKFKASFFNLVGPPNYQRPFELSSLRLQNMIQVINNWDIYMKYNEYLTQRGGTFLFDSNMKIKYFYRPQSLLSFSESMRDPLLFLEKFL